MTGYRGLDAETVIVEVQTFSRRQMSRTDMS